MRGWHNQSWRHSLAARRIKTSNKYLNGRVLARSRHGIPITVQQDPKPGTAYPVSAKDIKTVLDKMPDEAVEKLKEVNLRPPSEVAGAKQNLAYAQWVRTRENGGNRINIFTQKYKNGKFKDVEPDKEDPDNLRAHMKNYVIPHEIGHHVVTKEDNKMPIILEEAKADAFAARENYNDPYVIDRHISNRIMQFGNKGTV